MKLAADCACNVSAVPIAINIGAVDSIDTPDCTVAELHMCGENATEDGTRFSCFDK